VYIRLIRRNVLPDKYRFVITNAYANGAGLTPAPFS
jgi:hypothetical protein